MPKLSAILKHVGMTGSLRWLEGGAPQDRYDCVVFVTGTGELRYPLPTELRTSRHSPRPTGNHDVTVGEPVGIPGSVSAKRCRDGTQVADQPGVGGVAIAGAQHG